MKTGQKILRIAIDGRWKITEWINLFNKIDSVYSELVVIEYFLEKIRNVNKDDKANSEKILRNLTTDLNTYLTNGRTRGMFGTPSSKESESFFNREYRRIYKAGLGDFNYRLAEHFYTEGTWTGFTNTKPIVRKIRYGSPGWIELLGSLNPFKLIADCVRDWRKQNTEREKNKNQINLAEKNLNLDKEKNDTNERIENEKILLEKEKINSQERIELTKIQSEIFKYLLEKSSAINDLTDTAVPDELIRKLSVDIEKELIKLAQNSMITDIKISRPTTKSKKKYPPKRVNKKLK